MFNVEIILLSILKSTSKSALTLKIEKLIEYGKHKREYHTIVLV